MAARIEVEKLKDGEFRVRVIEGRSESTPSRASQRGRLSEALCREDRGWRTDPAVV